MKKNTEVSPKKTLSRRQFLKKSIAVSAASAVSFTFTKSIFSQSNSNITAKNIIDFKEPYGVALGADGRIYVSDAAGYCLKIFDRNGTLLKSIGKPGSREGAFNYPQGLGIDENGLIYVMDSNNGRVSIYDLDGNYKTSFGKIGGYPDAFYTPKGIHITDKIYVCNTRNHFIAVYEKNTFRLIAKYGDLGDDPKDLFEGSLDYHFRLPTDVVTSNDGKIYVVDSKHGQVKVLDSEGRFLFRFGELGSSDGQFNTPEGIAIDTKQNIYVCDSLNSRIQKFSPDGKFISAKTDGLKKPTTLQINSENTFYIVDAELKQVLITKWES
ncbi:6-bladed beta-propeller [candidate division KSB1 bacterium]|nr:6-bladed beta-propeller [candidate division KSB1 bacterium]MBL7092593.1 6-bladed beta-propeller [candidate division KSB1 bacterium]